MIKASASSLDRIEKLLRDERLNGRYPEHLTWVRKAARLSALQEVWAILREKNTYDDQSIGE